MTTRPDRLTRAARAAVLLTLALAVVWGIRVLFPSDEQLVRRALAETASALDALAGPRTRGLPPLAGAANFAGHFTPDLVLDLGRPFGLIEGRDQLVALAARGTAREWHISIGDIRVSPASSGMALVRLTITATSVASDGERSLERRTLNVGMRRVEKRWLIARVEVVEGGESLAAIEGERIRRGDSAPDADAATRWTA
jgi:hypothetical protein